MALLDDLQLKGFTDNAIKTLSDNTLNTNLNFTPKLNISNQMEQVGAFNVKGTLDLSTKKSAVLYAPITISNSPNATASSSPVVSQGGSDSPLNGLFSAPNTLIIVAGLGMALLLLTGAAKPSNTSVHYSTPLSAKTGNISAI